jgi:hypothetical protein
MISRLCGKIENITQRRVDLHRIQRGVFRYSVNVGEAAPFLNKLSSADLELFKRRATFSIDNPNQGQRSVIVPLQNPIQLGDVAINALRLKGAFPRTQAENSTIVEAYSEGIGFCRRLFDREGSTISMRTERGAEEFSGKGTMNYRSLENEVETALILGTEITDPLLGFGIFDELTFCDQPVGLAIYGMQRTDDIRYLHRISKIVEEEHSIMEETGNSERIGKLLRLTHEDRKIIHSMPHLENFATSPGDRMVMADLDHSKRSLSLPKEVRATHMFTDLSRTINDYMREWRVEVVYDGESEIVDFYLTRLLPHFLWGYFAGDTSIPFVRDVERCLNDRDDRSLFEVFGVLPKFGPGFAQPILHPTLIDPIVDVHGSPVGTKVDLESYSNPYFMAFYSALKALAQS